MKCAHKQVTDEIKSKYDKIGDLRTQASYVPLGHIHTVIIPGHVPMLDRITLYILLEYCIIQYMRNVTLIN